MILLAFQVALCSEIKLSNSWTFAKSPQTIFIVWEIGPAIKPYDLTVNSLTEHNKKASDSSEPPLALNEYSAQPKKLHFLSICPYFNKKLFYLQAKNIRKLLFLCYNHI